VKNCKQPDMEWRKTNVEFEAPFQDNACKRNGFPPNKNQS